MSLLKKNGPKVKMVNFWATITHEKFRRTKTKNWYIYRKRKHI